MYFPTRWIDPNNVFLLFASQSSCATEINPQSDEELKHTYVFWKQTFFIPAGFYTSWDYGNTSASIHRHIPISHKIKITDGWSDWHWSSCENTIFCWETLVLCKTLGNNFNNGYRLKITSVLSNLACYQTLFFSFNTICIRLFSFIFICKCDVENNVR